MFNTVLDYVFTRGGGSRHPSHRRVCAAGFPSRNNRPKERGHGDFEENRLFFVENKTHNDLFVFRVCVFWFLELLRLRSTQNLKSEFERTKTIVFLSHE